MALFDVSDFKRYSELRRQILPSGQTRLKEPTTHYSFGLKQQEFAVPVGVDVSIFILQESPGISSVTREGSKTARSTRRGAASCRASQVVSVEQLALSSIICVDLNFQDGIPDNVRS